MNGDISVSLTAAEMDVVIQALNAALKNEPNALQASQVIVPIAVKIVKAKEDHGNANSRI